MGSTAGDIVYEGGGGYTAAKHAETALVGTLRLELSGQPVRVIEIDPGMVRTDEFAIIRFGGDAEKAAAVYAGVAEPLTADDIADCVAWCATRPHHVNVDQLVVRPLAQAAQHKVHRVFDNSDRPVRACDAPAARSAWSPAAPRTRTGCAGSTRGSPIGVPPRSPPRTIRSSSTSASARPRSRRSSCARGWSRSAPDVRVVGLEIDPVRVAAAQASAAPPGLTFRRGGFELAGLRPIVVRAFNVLRQYDESAVTAAWTTMTDALAPGGFLVDGTCDERGRLASWVLLDASGPISLTLAARLANLDRPATLAERLPKALDPPQRRRASRCTPSSPLSTTRGRPRRRTRRSAPVSAGSRRSAACARTGRSSTARAAGAGARSPSPGPPSRPDPPLTLDLARPGR